MFAFQTLLKTTCFHVIRGVFCSRETVALNLGVDMCAHVVQLQFPIGSNTVFGNILLLQLEDLCNVGNNLADPLI